MDQSLSISEPISSRRVRVAEMGLDIPTFREGMMSRAPHEVSGTVVEDVIIQPGRPWGRVLKQGQHLRMIDLEGKQALDFLCYNADNPRDRYNASNTMKLAANVYISKGCTLWSDRAAKLMTVIEDTCGFHDTIGGCCSAEMNVLRYDAKGPANCRDTFEIALKFFGLTRDDIVTNINWFMYVPVGPDGHMAMTEGISKPGDYVDLIAERDVICVVSNCAQIYNPCNAFKPTPVRIITYDAR